ncbi:MAG: HTH domain-containing protein [Halovenus sp.]
MSEETCEVVVFPLTCLAVYGDGKLRAVFPCSSEERTWTVDDCLDWIEVTRDRRSPDSPMSEPIHETNPVEP